MKITKALMPGGPRRWISGRLASMMPDTMSRVSGRPPIFIIGCGRSGTSLLYNVLSTHGKIVRYADEANELWHPKCYPWRTAEISVPPIWVDPYTFTRRSLQSRTNLDDRKLRATFGAYQLLFVRGTSQLLIKSAMIAFMLPFVQKMYPQARFIHILRDGRSVALSYAKKLGNRHSKNVDYWFRKHLDAKETRDLSDEERSRMLLLRLARHWREHMDEIDAWKLQLPEPGRFLEFRYEDLCSEPDAILEDAADFMNVSAAGFSTDAAAGIESTNKKARLEVDEETTARLEEEIGETLLRKGYALREHV